MSEQIATGLEAFRIGHRLAALFGPITGLDEFGHQVTIAPGSFDVESRTYYLGQAAARGYFIRGTTLYAAALADIIHGVQVGGVTRQIAARTRLVVPMYGVAMGFSMGMAGGALSAIGGAAGLIGTGASGAVLAWKIAVFYNSHTRAVNLCVTNIGLALDAMRWFKEHCPTLYSKLAQMFRAAAWSAVLSTPGGFSSSDAAAAFGRLLGGLAGAPEVGLGVLLRILGGVASQVAVRVPAMAARSVRNHAQSVARQLVDGFHQAGVPTNTQDLDRIVRELDSHPEAVQRLESLRLALAQAAPTLQSLLEQFRRER